MKNRVLLILFSTSLLMWGCGPHPHHPPDFDISGYAGCRHIGNCGPENLDFLLICCDFLEQGNLTEVVARLDAGELFTPACPAIVLLAAECYLAQDRMEDALDVLNSQISQPFNPDEAMDLDRLSSELESALREQIARLRNSNDNIRFLGSLNLYNTRFDFREAIFTEEMNVLMEQEMYDLVIRRINPLSGDYKSEELMLLLARAFRETGDNNEALAVLEEALQKGGGEPVIREYQALKSIMLLREYPENLKDIENIPWVSRSDFAAYVAWRFDISPFLTRVPIIVDISGIHDSEAIESVVSAGIISLDRNRRFKPDKPIRKMDLAVYLSRIAELFSIKPIFRNVTLPGDISDAHIAAGAILYCLELNIIDVESDGLFHGSRTVTGKEVTEAVDRVKVP